MTIKAWHLPWTFGTVPHAVLDVIRDCNISCQACYNICKSGMKSCRQVEAELDTILLNRKIHSVTVTGGEITLHPEITEIIRMVRGKGLHVQLVSNGVLLEPDLLSKLKKAGTELIFVHVDRGQKRPDLPSNATIQQVCELRHQKGKLIREHGINAGITTTAFKDKLQELVDTVEFTINSPYIDYLLVTNYRDVPNFKWIKGNLRTGMHGELDEPEKNNDPQKLTNEDIYKLLKTTLGLNPFACLGSNFDKDALRWLSYTIVTAMKKDQLVCSHSLKASLFERFFLKMYRMLAGRYPFYQSDSSSRLKIQLLMNSLAGGSIKGNMKILKEALCRDTSVRAKRILFQSLAEFDEDGRLIHCRNCPDAVIRNGQLVPVCIADKIISK